MNGRNIVLAFLGLVFLAATFDAEAGRRSLRIDFGDWTQSFALGGENCPGTTPTSPDVVWSGIQFGSGSFQGTYSVDKYCQQALEFDPDNPNDPYFSEASLFAPGDAGLADKVGPNNDPDPSNRVTANRFTFLDGDRFDEPPPSGYQWEFYFFPNNRTLVRLNGLIQIPGGNDFSPFIEDDGEIIWDSEVSGYDGEYWCFDNGLYVGAWDGEPAGTSALAGCELPPTPTCFDLEVFKVGVGALPTVSPANSPGCPVGKYVVDELITLTAGPAPGFKISRWDGTDDDSSLALVNELTFYENCCRGGGPPPDPTIVGVVYEDALVCPQLTVEQTYMSEDMEDGAGGWTHSATLGSDTWTLQDEVFLSPTNAWNGQAIATASDQRLVSPAVTIPQNTPFVRLSYYNKRAFEEGSGCADGAILEYSTNGGTDWEWFALDDFERDPYNDWIEWPTGYPERFENSGWCRQEEWTLTEVDISHLAGETLNFRFRIGTDDVAPPAQGWWIDDVQVKGCLADVVFDNNFEAQ